MIMHRFSQPPVSQLFAPRGALFFTHAMRPDGWSPKLWFNYGLGTAIRMAERTKGEARSWANHVGVVTQSGYLTRPAPGHEALVSEALWKVKLHKWWEAHKDENVAIAVFRYRNLNLIQEKAIVEDAISRTGRRYAWWRLFSYLGERLTKIPFSKLHVLENRNVCSNHAGKAWEAGLGALFPERPGRLDPDDMMDFCELAQDRIEFLGWSVV